MKNISRLLGTLVAMFALDIFSSNIPSNRPVDTGKTQRESLKQHMQDKGIQVEESETDDSPTICG